MASLIDPSFGLQLIFILGITNIIGLLLVFFSCRCLIGKSLFMKLMQFGWYKKMHSMHCYYWWFFIASVALHTVLAFMIF